VTRFTVSVLPEAEADIREAFLWYRERSLLAADGFRSEVFEAIDDRAESGGVWPRDKDGVHRRVLKRFPYTIHYELAESVVTVLAVAHHSRLPALGRIASGFAIDAAPLGGCSTTCRARTCTNVRWTARTAR
jgi:plasmid stabilization system protein ParE